MAGLPFLRKSSAPGDRVVAEDPSPIGFSENVDSHGDMEPALSNNPAAEHSVCSIGQHTAEADRHQDTRRSSLA